MLKLVEVSLRFLLLRWITRNGQFRCSGSKKRSGGYEGEVKESRKSARRAPLCVKMVQMCLPTSDS
jgi:hypothetical protein